ncbi:MAG TPA: hypothetical protein VMS75_07070 [Terriglobales bacterium]|nr:hypothetical protein [Terriglobales bacterium]
MTVFKAIGNGAGTASRRPLALAVLWVTDLVFAVLIVAPWAALVRADLGHSLLGRSLHALDFLWLGEAVYRYQSAAPALLAGWLVLLAVYFGLSVFLNGGVIGRLLDREGRTTFQTFFADCGRHFGRFVRLFLVSVVFYALAFGTVLGLFSMVTARAAERARTEWTPLGLSWARTLIALLLLSLLHMVFDYARIFVVAEDERRVLRALGKALAFLGRRFFRAWALYLLVGAGLVAGAALYFAAAGLIPGSGLAWLGLGLVWGQAFVVFRFWTKMVFFSAQAEYALGERE